VIRGSGKISIADPEKLLSLNKYTFSINKRLHTPVPYQIVSTGHGHLIEVVGKSSCYKCGSFCHRSNLRYGKRSDLTAGRRCQAVEYYLPWLYGHEDEPIETLFYAPKLANDYSIDTFEMRI